MKRFFLAYLIAILIPLIFYFYFDNQEMPQKRKLKRFIPLTADSQQPNKVMVKDTLWHTIPNFSFTTQTGDAYTAKDTEDKLLIVGFFSSNDKTRLVKMGEYFLKLQEEFQEDKEVLLLAHTLTPSVDTLERLEVLVQQYKVDTDKWFFLRGSENSIDQFIEEAYHLPRPERVDSSEVNYSNKYVVVGRKGIIRGYYELENLEDLKVLMSDIRWIQLEYPTKHKREIEWKLRNNE